MSGKKDACLRIEPLDAASFGCVARLEPLGSTAQHIVELEAQPDLLPAALNEADGLLVIKGMNAISEDPLLLFRLSRLFGPEVENYRETLTPERLIHPAVPQIIQISNLAPMNFDVPAKPEPPLDAQGTLPVQFPHRKGWHTDQSFRRPPPDISLFYAQQPCPKGQGQTLFADGFAAYAALSETQKERIDKLEAVHAIPWTGRGEDAVRAGETPKPLESHQHSQRQPIVREHPVSHKKALYLCEEGQLDWVIGPIAELRPGPGEEGGQLIYELMTHYTQPAFTYIHDWDEGDLVIYDNRNLVHSATWFDAKKHGRVMWRTTVMGNPGSYYDGEAKSWLPPAGKELMGKLDY